MMLASHARPRGPTPRLLLASRSPRRRELLHNAGIDFDVVASGIDDGELSPGRADAVAWTMALAYLKARAAHDPQSHDGVTLLGADTVCLLEGRIIGQPASRDDAEATIRAFMGRDHDVITGVCLLGPGARELFAVRATVSLGDIPSSDLAAYLDSGAWAVKAGAYNYDDRVRAGWPLRCRGDTTAVTGLPMQELTRRLARRSL